MRPALTRLQCWRTSFATLPKSIQEYRSPSRSWHRGVHERSQALRAMAEATLEGPSLSMLHVSVPSEEVGQQIAGALVEGRLAACVNIIPGIQSVYMWKGKVERDEEHLLVIKTQSTLVPDVVARVKALHPYVEPEVVALPISGGSASYLAWVAECTTHKTA
ncbi:CUTA1 [Auxenochlorella protothecoides x Auxenochlorella symbiontica]